VDFFACGAGDGGGLGAQDFWLGVSGGWAVRGGPGGGGEVVAVALGEGGVLLASLPLSPAHYSPLRGSSFGPAFGCSALRSSREGRGGLAVHAEYICARKISDWLFQHLWLFAFVVEFGDQPEVVPAGSWVALQFEEVAAAQGRLVAVGGGLVV